MRAFEPREVGAALALLALAQAATLGQRAAAPEPLATCGYAVATAPRGLEGETSVPSDLTVGEHVRGEALVVNRTARTVEVRDVSALLVAAAGSTPVVPPGPVQAVDRRLEPGQFLRADVDLTVLACRGELDPGFYEVAVAVRLVDPVDGSPAGVALLGRRAVVLRR